MGFEDRFTSLFGLELLAEIGLPVAVKPDKSPAMIELLDNSSSHLCAHCIQKVQLFEYLNRMLEVLT